MAGATKPEPDGKLVVALKHDVDLRVSLGRPLPGSSIAPLITDEASASVREYSISEAKWEAQYWGLEITRGPSHPAGRGKDIFPYGNLLSFTVTANSAEYELKLLEFIRQCEHQWITHPHTMVPLTYCETCRVDMADLASVMDPSTTSTPALVVESSDLDRVSHAFDGRDPFQQQQQQDVHNHGPTTIVLNVDEISDDVHRIVDEQLGSSDIDDPDTTEF